MKSLYNIGEWYTIQEKVGLPEGSIPIQEGVEDNQKYLGHLYVNNTVLCLGVAKIRTIPVALRKIYANATEYVTIKVLYKDMIGYILLLHPVMYLEPYKGE